MEYTQKETQYAREASVQSYLKELRKYPPLSREEEQKVLRKAKEGEIKRRLTRLLRQTCVLSSVLHSNIKDEACPLPI